MKRKIRKNEHGFTLIELLAVIVVLAIVLLMGATAIIPRMNDARKQVFALEANQLIESAEQYLQNNALTGKGLTFPVSNQVKVCLTIDDLLKSGDYSGDTEKYDGLVLIEKKENASLYLYTVYLTNGTLMVNGEGHESDYNVDITTDMVKDYDSSEKNNFTTCPTGTKNTSSTSSSTGTSGSTSTEGSGT